MTNSPFIYLASASPRRAELLDQIQVNYQLSPQDIDESPLKNEVASQLVNRLAFEKARKCLTSLQHFDDVIVLGSDTIIAFNDKILGKPRDIKEAELMLSELSGHTHQVMTAIYMMSHTKEESELCISNVSFRKLSASEIKNYCESLEPLDKAGAYAIQGKAAAFISNISGSYSGIMGLPLFETHKLLNAFHYPIYR